MRVDSPLPNGTVITNGSYGIDSNETSAVNGAPVNAMPASVINMSLGGSGAPTST